MNLHAKHWHAKRGRWQPTKVIITEWNTHITRAKSAEGIALLASLLAHYLRYSLAKQTVKLQSGMDSHAGKPGHFLARTLSQQHLMDSVPVLSKSWSPSSHPYHKSDAKLKVTHYPNCLFHSPTLPLNEDLWHDHSRQKSNAPQHEPRQCASHGTPFQGAKLPSCTTCALREGAVAGPSPRPMGPVAPLI